jgi:pimeloyl-ACP methyl ester carboxylesterase
MLRTFAGGEVLGEVWGPDPPTVLALHGWRRTHADFAKAAGGGASTPSASWAAVDLPGFGASPVPPEPWGSADYASVVARVIEDLSGQPMVVLGHSFGGRVAVHLAASRPDLVRALVLTAAPLVRIAPPRKAPASFRIVKALQAKGLVPESMLERARNKYGSADYRASEGVVRQVLVRTLGENYDAQLAGITSAVELVWGDDDKDVPLPVAHAVAEKVPQAVLTVCPGAGHLTPLTVPERLREAVDRALAAPANAGAH